MANPAVSYSLGQAMTSILRRKAFWPVTIALCIYIAHSFSLQESSPISSPIVRRSSERERVTVGPRDLFTDSIRDANYTLSRRDEYACKKGTPCKQYACCGGFSGGDIGECGLGPAWCGADCDSQCDAHAECGSWANPPGKTCPLNTCCSQYGFCGTTVDFCTNKCQSNCVSNPPVPAGKSSAPVLKRVIGYYESWSSQRSCHAFPPSALPVDGLTHVNYAFAYIDPGSLKITPMDSSTAEDSFQQTTDVHNLKSGNSAVEVFISVGGWSFSDNGTSTQGVFGSIAADAGKRQQFADNLVAFMKQYGFDGIDIDWEYPGAPDRGGSTQDTENYVKLLQTLRQTFSASERGSYGLTFTIPSSYWYLRWFDLPSMVKYADWINVMSYDLHGVWDRNNPIGSIVQGHTNLTEIQLSVDLLWRVQIPPEKIVLGLGFYGRAFQLADTGCSKPGCQFAGAAAPGPCTNSAGTLGYFEIMDIINTEKPTVQHDVDAAVNYIQFGANHDQWVSYDDSVTFKQKVDWANNLGLGGVMIWAVDLDDNNFSALSGLVGKSLPSFADELKKTQITDTGHWASQNGQKCIMTDCLDDAKQPDGYAMAPGGDAFTDTCGGGQKRYIYCPIDAMPSSCQWRGSGSCHGQCHPGEVTLFHSPDGSTRCLKPGMQAFCCVTNTWANLINGCAFQDYGITTCPSDKSFQPNDGYIIRSISICPGGGPPCVVRNYKSLLCCSFNFQGCHWVGQGTCDDNECSDTDIELALDPAGATGQTCWWGRQKPLCCNTPNNLSPFLPVSLDKLFPTLPPDSDIPVFDKSTIGSGPSLVGEANPQAFGLVVIDGPPGAVKSLRKRDGSHISFVDCDQERGNGRGIAQFVCMNDSKHSNCKDMHLGGLAGTILAMPDDCGFASYVVAHSVMPSLNQTLRGELRERAPPGAVLYDLEYSYDFSLAKRDSGDIYVRVDYSDSNDYFNQIVAADHQKRTLKSRFWSGSLNVWKNLIRNLRIASDQGFNAALNKDNFDILLYGDDGSDNNCSGGNDGFLNLRLSGSVKSSIKWGVTLVGTIAPSLHLEEAYSYFDSNPKLSGTLTFNGKGVLAIGGGKSIEPLFSSPITNYEFSHPGIVSFSPNLQIQAQLVGSGQIDGDFTLDFQAGNQATFQVHQPSGLGSYAGGSAGLIPNNPFKGSLEVNTAAAAALSDNTVFALELVLENSLRMQVFEYNTNVMNGGANLNARVPHRFRITGGPQMGVYDGDVQASIDAGVNGSMANWVDSDTFPVGAALKPKDLQIKSSLPPKRTPDKPNGFAIFGGRKYIQCSLGAGASNLTCPGLAYLGIIDPRFNAPDDGSEPLASPRRRRSLEGLVTLEKRTGSERPFNVHDITGAILATILSHTYWTGGNQLLQHNPAAGYSDLNNHDCVDTSFNNNAPIPAGTSPAAEHIYELQTHPRQLEWDQGVGFTLPNGNTVRSQYTPVDRGVYAAGGRYLSAWSSWDPAGQTNAEDEAPVDDIWRAYGDTNNAGHMVNTEPHFNNLKMQIFRGNDPISNENWASQNLDDTTQTSTAEEAIGAIRDVLSMYEYMNGPNLNNYWTSSANDIRAARAHFQTRYNMNVPPGAQPLTNLPERHTEYITRFLLPALRMDINLWAERRINILIADWDTALESARGQRAVDIRGILEALSQLKDQNDNLSFDSANVH